MFKWRLNVEKIIQTLQISFRIMILTFPVWTPACPMWMDRHSLILIKVFEVLKITGQGRNS
jgi:hypothetical protein